MHHPQSGIFSLSVAAVQPKLIFTNRYLIREMNVNGTNSRLLVANLTNAVGLDYDISENCIYWSDVTHISSSIKKMCNNSKPMVSGSPLLSCVHLLHQCTTFNFPPLMTYQHAQVHPLRTNSLCNVDIQ